MKNENQKEIAWDSKEIPFCSGLSCHDAGRYLTALHAAIRVMGDDCMNDRMDEALTTLSSTMESHSKVSAGLVESGAMTKDEAAHAKLMTFASMANAIIVLCSKDLDMEGLGCLTHNGVNTINKTYDQFGERCDQEIMILRVGRDMDSNGVHIGADLIDPDKVDELIAKTLDKSGGQND